MPIPRKNRHIVLSVHKHGVGGDIYRREQINIKYIFKHIDILVDMETINKDENLDEYTDFSCCGKNEWGFGPKTVKLKSYWVYNIIAALLHGVNALLMVILYAVNDGQDVCYQLSVGYASWEQLGASNVSTPDNNFIITQKRVNSSKLSLHYLIFGFHLLSCVFQLIPALFDSETCFKCTERDSWLNYPYTELVEKENRNPIRFIEYSVSASIMLVCIALLTGIYDEIILIAIGVLCAACQMCGLLAEYLEGARRLLVHVMGWVTLMTAYGIIWAYYGVANYQAGDNGAPNFVHAIVIVMFALFNTFGIIQLTQYYCKGCKDGKIGWWNWVWGGFYRWVGQEAELSYVWMSLIAKTVLGWIIYAQVIVMARGCD